MWRKTAVILLSMGLIFVSFNCQKKTQVKGLDLEVSFSEEKLSDHLITDMQYTWKTDSEFERMSRDYHVFVHFWHNDNLLIQDDHVPEVSPSQWKEGEEYTYKRRIYIPEFIDVFDPNFKGKEKLKLEVGLFSPYDQTGKTKHKVMQKKLEVYPPPADTPEVIYEDGWYDLERNPNTYLKKWRWTAKKARCIIDNPHRDALLVIKGGVNMDAVKDQKVIFKINDMTLDEFVPEKSHFEKSYNIKKEMLGEKDEFYLTIATNKTFIPAEISPDSNDKRELGIQISFIYFR